MTIKELAQKVADYFNGVIEEEEFENFEAMKQCYWWDSNDIKDEVEAVIKDFNWYLTDDRTELYDGNFGAKDEYYSYRKFMVEVYKNVK